MAVSPDDLLSIKVKIPCLQEQQEIISIIELFNRKIELHEQLVNDYRNLKENYLRKIFDSAISLTHDESQWEYTTLQEILKGKIINGVFNDSNKIGRGAKFINVSDLYNEPYIDDTNLALLEVDEKQLKKFGVKKND